MTVPAPAMTMQAQYMPPMYVQAPARRGSRIESFMSMLLVMVIVAIVAVGGYALSRSLAPSPYEVDRYQALAEQQGVFNGRNQGYGQGRAFGIAEQQTIAKYQGLIGRAKNYNKGYRRGMRTGRSGMNYRGSGYSGYRGSGYSPYRGGYGNNSAASVNSAVGFAQNYANATGSVVDIELY